MTTADAEQNTLFDQPDPDPPRPPRREGSRLRLRDRILAYIAQQGPRGATDGEIQEGLNISGDSERPRRGELADTGEIVFSGRTRPTRSGEPAKVWTLADDADAPEPPAEKTPSAPKPAPNPPSRPAHNRKPQSRRLAEEREKNLGPTLDAMTAEDLEALCKQTLPGWPNKIFGREHTPQSAREDRVIRGLLLKAIDPTNPSTM